MFTAFTAAELYFYYVFLHRLKPGMGFGDGWYLDEYRLDFWTDILPL